MAVPVHVYYADEKHSFIAQKETTIGEILKQLNISDTIVFSGPLTEPYKTPLVDLDKTLVDYNMWFLDGYIAQLTVYNETDNYDRDMYTMYLTASRRS
jgi:hypothetical protein